MALKLQSPHPFAERLLLFAGAGAGKTNAALSVIQYAAEGEMFVCESDYSMAYDRALATDYADVADRVHVTTADPDWDSYTEALAEVCTAGNPETDWVDIDSISPSWEYVQNWYLQQVYGDDLPAFLTQLKREHKDDLKAYSKALSELMNWGTVKKEYAAKVYKPIQRWKGNIIVTAEAKKVGDRENDDVAMEFGPIGYKPSGEPRLMYVASTNLFLSHPKRKVWKMTSTKDRNREELDDVTVENFAMDYLQDVAGWEMVKV